MKHLFISLFLSISLVGCGGGGGSDKSPVPSTSALSTSSTSSSSRSSEISISSSISSKEASSSSSVSSVASSILFTFTSNSFISGEKIPLKYSCFGPQLSPHLQWDITSADIKSFALIMEDYDAIALVGHPYVHWVVYNIPADVRQIAEGATLLAMPAGSIEGINHDDLRKYSGPCPPEGTGTHHYFFALYALNKESISLNAIHPTLRSEFETTYATSIIQKVVISGTYIYQ